VKALLEAKRGKEEGKTRGKETHVVLVDGTRGGGSVSVRDREGPRLSLSGSGEGVLVVTLKEGQGSKAVRSVVKRWRLNWLA
jgi:hypothetical protein